MNVNHSKIDFTEGNLTPLIFSFSLPIILGQVIQSLFNTADQVVLGQMAGGVAVASVGACATIVGLIVNFFSGLSGGVTIVLARAFGERDHEKIRRIIGTAMVYSLFVGLIATALGESLAVWLLDVTQCPADCVEGALVYLRIYYVSIPAITVYNFGAAILRVSGDSRRPMFYLTAAGILNIVLNVVLCFLLRQKVAAVAIATAASQVLGAILVVNRLLHLEEDYRLDLHALVFDGNLLLKFLRYGIPTAFNAALYNIANLQICAAINSYDYAATAGFSAASNITNIISSINAGYQHTVLASVGQNLGAEKSKRVTRSILLCLFYCTVLSQFFGLLVFFLRAPLIAVFLPDLPEALPYATSYFTFVTACYGICAMMGIFSSTLNAFGYSFFVTICNLTATVVFRTFWMQVVYPMNRTFDMIQVCFTISWLIMLVLYICVFSVVYARFRKGKYRRI